MAKRVMVVDDSFMMRVLVSDIIKRDPEFELVGEAKNGQEALDKVKSLKPDVVLMDIEMPEMNGLECLKRMRLISNAKVVIISSVAQTGSPQALEARKLGAADVIDKPSGSVSLDLVDKRSSAVLKSVRSALGMSPPQVVVA